VTGKLNACTTSGRGRFRVTVPSTAFPSISILKSGRGRPELVSTPQPQTSTAPSCVSAPLTVSILHGWSDRARPVAAKLTNNRNIAPNAQSDAPLAARTPGIPNGMVPEG